jgi:hypothetical protein
MAKNCCDGTGWTGQEGVLCHAHYEPMTGWLELNHFDVVEGP